MSSKSEALIKKYLNHTCTPEELAIIESWYNTEAASAEAEEDDIDYEQLDKELWKSLKKTTGPVSKIDWRLISAAAACLLMCLLFYYSVQKPIVQQSATLSAAPLLPGSNKAELRLADGSVLQLTDDRSGLLRQQDGAMITKHKGGRLSYAAAGSTDQVALNTLSTPKGGQYQVDLPDGTRAWLNAASSIQFPTVFKDRERRVQISGEVYFEVAHDKQKPFKVISRGQTIVVLGTHFNVSAYPDEAFTKTTLLEGAVKVMTDQHVVVIKPGEQAFFRYDSQEITVKKTDTEEVMAWRRGYFQFNNEDIKSIMQKISRWYDIEVDYSKDFVSQRFSGSVSRFENASKVLKMLEYTGTIHFKTEGRRVRVMP